MYNRYIPQQDGTFQKNRVQSNQQNKQHKDSPCPEQPCEQANPVAKQPIGAGQFLRQLLPKNMDTGDLLIIILLLLMAGDCDDSKNTWLLTLALYLFL